MPPTRRAPATTEIGLDGDKLGALLANMPASPEPEDYQQLLASLKGLLQEFQTAKENTKKVCRHCLQNGNIVSDYGGSNHGRIETKQTAGSCSYVWVGLREERCPCF